MVSQDKRQGEQWLGTYFEIFRQENSPPLRTPTPTWNEIIHVFPHRNLNVSRGSRWYLTTWRTNRFFSPLRHSCFKSHYSPYERKAIKASTTLPFPLTTLMRNIFQANRNGYHWLHLNGSHEASWKKDSNLCFETAFSHDAGYSISHTHAPPILSICLILWQLLPFSLQTLLHQGLWASQGKHCCHSWSYSLIYTISNSIMELRWWSPLTEDPIYLRVSEWHLKPWTEVGGKRAGERKGEKRTLKQRVQGRR